MWSGSISFGLVNVPVKAYTAMRDHSVHFHQLEKGTGARIRYQKISDTTGKEVAADDIEQGYEISLAEAGAAPSKVLDLMAALEASLSAAKSKGAKKDLPAAKGAPAKKKAPTKKQAAGKRSADRKSA